MATKGFHLELVCEACGEPTERLVINKLFMYCSVCDEAKKRRDRFLAEEKEWEAHVNDS